MAAGFKDHFSSASDAYAAFRPDYPDALYAWLAGQCGARAAAWDCATGNGQAARGLAAHFGRIVATDASAEQIRHAQPHPGVDYRVASAEASGLATASVDLVTVAQAAHWFDLPRFYAEARRVLKPAGILAVWGYGRLVLPDPLDAPYLDFYARTLGPYWPAERALVEDGYRGLPFPFPPVQAPAFAIRVEWNLPRLIAYLSTWSAVKRYQAARGHDPLPDLQARLTPAWGEPMTARALAWPLFLRAGRSAA
ncbi:class I SAM-dependent methyltransferase [Betaproteobacteria bacterium SCN1]|jgi:SAM-dependent methyltransferase|nr:class I SAM-dependent methyltransferase [Betaproteobacteria bacterium SCN1]MBN8760284.1 class I SAM-dependent methyltransferase [Thiobacillus sp.]ODU90020.1 MAG: SAM-dependent methyltransferase [Thiobacillus sp. SCN 65-179]OJW39658.1 MAG: SAM-dependent methyltransferase [Thiobacillus sp. 65-69]